MIRHEWQRRGWGGSMRVVGRVGNVLLVCLLIFAGYSVIRAVRSGQEERARRDDHRPLVLGPTGIGKLRLGMSERQAAATGEATLSDDQNSRDRAKCSLQEVNGVTIHFARDRGIVGLAGPPERTRTPEGIGAGSSVADITAAYPAAPALPELGSPQEQVNLLGGFSAPVPGNPNALYHFVFAEFEFTIDGSTTRPKANSTRSDRSKLKYVLLALRGPEDCLLIS
jgi:hypothetical protein